MASNDIIDVNADIRILERGLRRGAIKQTELDARWATLPNVGTKSERIELAPLMAAAKDATARRREKAATEEPASAHRIPVPTTTYEDDEYGYPARPEGDDIL